MKIKPIICILITLLISNSLIGAEPIFIQGKGVASYNNLFGKPDQKFIDESKSKAIFDAINRGIEQQPEALRSQFKSVAVSMTVQDYINKRIVLETDNKWNTITNEREVISQYQGRLDLTALRDFLNSIPLSELQNQPKLSNALVAVFFTVRETAEKTSFDAEKRTENTATASNAKNNESQGDISESDTGVTKSETSIVQGKIQEKTMTSGSTTEKADKVQYSLDDMSKELFGDGLKSRFSSKGINEIFDGAMFESAEQLDKFYGAGESIRSQTWKSVTENISTEEPSIQYLIVGTLDFSFPTKDSISGMPIYSGTVSGKVYKLREAGKMPTVVGGLPPLEAKLPAPTQQDAKKRVVAKLSELAADEIISYLKQKGIL